MRQDYKRVTTKPDKQAKLTRKKSNSVGQDFVRNAIKKSLIERILS